MSKETTMHDELSENLQRDLEVLALLRAERNFWAGIPGDQEHARTKSFEKALEVALKRALEHARLYVERGPRLPEPAGFLPPSPLGIGPG